MRHLVLVVCLTATPCIARAGATESTFATAAGITVPFLEHPPLLEDFLTATPHGEAASAMTRIDRFAQLEPDEGKAASEGTVAYVGRDAERLYVVFVADVANPATLRAHLSRRDEIYDDDRVGVWLDTFSTQRESQLFLVNPRNVQGDIQYTDPEIYDLTFDAVWDSRAVLTKTGYVAWLAIPFRSLRFPDAAVQRWRLMLERTIAHRGEYAYWPALSTRVDGRARQLVAADGIEHVSSGRPFELTPYTSFRSARRFDDHGATAPGLPVAGDAANVGLDAKAVLHDSVVVDATVNPDFSQIESDQPQVLVNQRYEVVFPERRPFFLENAPLFGALTDGERLQPFFSRRVIEPRLGARVSGRMGPWTAGALVADDRDANAFDAVAVLRRRLPSRSDVGVFGSLREADGHRNAVAAGEGRITLGPNWSAAALAGASTASDPGSATRSGSAALVELRREGSHFYSRTRGAAIAPGFRDELGFVPRVDMRALDGTARWLWRPGGALVWHGPHVTAERIWDHAGHRLDENLELGYEARAVGSNQITLLRREQSETYRGLRLRKSATEIQLASATLDRLSGSAIFDWGRAINYDPLPALAPAVGPSRSLTLNAMLRLSPGVRLDESLLLTRLRTPDGAGRVFDDRILRSTLRVQVSRALSARVILDHHTLDTNPRWSSVAPSRTLTTDLLLAYELRPATALFVGYGSASAGVDAANADGFRPATLAPVARQLFVKASYLFRP